MQLVKIFIVANQIPDIAEPLRFHVHSLFYSYSNSKIDINLKIATYIEGDYKKKSRFSPPEYRFLMGRGVCNNTITQIYRSFCVKRKIQRYMLTLNCIKLVGLVGKEDKVYVKRC